MDQTTLSPLFAVEVIATVRTDAAGLRRWVHGGAARKCRGATPAAMTLGDRLRISAPDPAEALRLARVALMESARAAGVEVGCVHARLAERAPAAAA